MIRINFWEGKCMTNQSISKIAYLVLLWSAHCGFAEEKFTALATLQQGWEKSRTEVQAKLDKEYLAQLTEKRKSLVRKGELDAARAVDREIKGEEKGADEPFFLTKLRAAREVSLSNAWKPLDKRYWEELKKLRSEVQQQGNLAHLESVLAAIKDVLSGYQNESDPEKLRMDPVKEVMLTTLKPVSRKSSRGYKINENSLQADLFINGRLCDDYIYDCTPSQLTYNIPPFAKWFTAIGGRLPGTSSSFKFIVEIDGSRVFESKPLSEYEKRQVEVNVEIPPESFRIELRIDELGNINNDHSLWAYPRFSSKRPEPNEKVPKLK